MQSTLRMPAMLMSDLVTAVNERAFQYYGSLRAVRDFVTLRYGERITLAAVARVARMERTYFSAFFHRRVGIPFRDWLRDFRVRKAMDLLKESDQPITAVAKAVGFQQIRSFERAFKKTSGMTPVQYKRLHRP
ncbi:MAG: AraC family transcriptional regulator [Acidobacteria bacterium]|nr:MAG: AraC family transcriptional regulator [Acidobacteriota bacterium]